MRARIKFTKTDTARYISHLDLMRYFQKALRRVSADVSMSEGFSPHMQMSFALPLSLGMTSTGEYFDVEMNSLTSAEQLKEELNTQMTEGIRIVSVVVIPQDKAHKCMTLVAAADYTVELDAAEGMTLPDFKELSEKAETFLEQKEISLLKKTKKGESLVNLRPGIFEMSCDVRGVFYLRLGAGSANHVNCASVMEKFLEFAGLDPAVVSMEICRRDLLMPEGEGFVPLDHSLPEGKMP